MRSVPAVLAAKPGPAIIAGFARGTPHDGYFFDHPDEVICGAIPPPRFNLENLAALERHVNSLVLEEAALDYANSLEPMLTDRGELIESNVGDLVRRLEAGCGRRGTTRGALVSSAASRESPARGFRVSRQLFRARCGRLSSSAARSSRTQCSA